MRRFSLTMWQLLMVDVVVNHMGWNGTAADIQYNTLTPFNNSAYFHPYCDIAQNATTVSTFCQEEVSFP
jgi:hypothetical protein